MRKLKHFASGFIVALLVISMCGAALASSGVVQKELHYKNIKVTLDGEQIALIDANGNPVEPFIIDGTTYLPVRAVSGALGLDVGWDGATSTVTLTRPEAEKAIYITRTGKKYHYDSTCNGGKYFEVPYATAIGFGLEPCNKCVLKK